jgi:hypothetical protein
VKVAKQSIGTGRLRRDLGKSTAHRVFRVTFRNSKVEPRIPTGIPIKSPTRPAHLKLADEAVARPLAGLARNAVPGFRPRQN